MSVIFDQLRISDDGKRLYLNAHINKASYFENAYIDSITIMSSDQVSETSPELPTDKILYKKVLEENQKEVNLVLTATDFLRSYESIPNKINFKQSDISKTLFFVYITIKWEGNIPTNIPCGFDELTTLGVVFDENILYQKVMNYTKDLVDNCSIHTGFIDFILLWNAFKASIETEHYIAAIKFFNMLFSTSNLGNKDLIKDCGCHG